ncbi:MAG: alpha/beta fold hydrolase [Rhodospirillales bacterium]|nr:alpha/beta fold hydrolase [Rhodospirillales bacterium]MBO6786578.1 alpha/beta fold hydrolase [Rhodospirillales bacterium]
MKIPLLLLPGLLCDEGLWASQLDALSDHCDCVVADMTQDDSIAGMASRAIARMPETFAVCGLSMGGYTAMEVMRQAGDRVSRLALFDTSPYADTPDRIEIRKGLIERVKGGAFENVIEEHFQSFVHPSRLSDTELMGRIRSSALNVGAAAYIREQTAIIGRVDSTDSLSKVSCPTLVLCGAEDALTPPSLHDEMAALVHGATLVKIDGSGHLPTVEKPDAVVDAMRDWLEIA